MSNATGRLSLNSREIMGMVINTLISRQSLTQGGTNLGGRNVDAAAGYPEKIDSAMYHTMFRRVAVAGRVVSLWPDECWAEPPEVYESEIVDQETAFERKVEALEKQHFINSYLHRIDVLSGIGQFGCLLIGIDDGKPLSEPVDGVTGIMPDLSEMIVAPLTPNTPSGKKKKKRGGLLIKTPTNKAPKPEPTGNLAKPDHKEPEPVDGEQKPNAGPVLINPEDLKTKRKLLFLRVFEENLVTITAFEADPTSPRYGLPTYYDLKLGDPTGVNKGSGTGLETTTVRVHWSRVLHVADNRMSSEVFGCPRLEGVYNEILNIRKVLGGSAEMFWQGGFPSIIFQQNPELLLQGVEFDKEEFAVELEKFTQGLQRYLTTSGLDPKQMTANLADPTKHLDANLQAIAMRIGVPLRLLLGSEQAQLASEQDRSNWLGRVAGRNGKYTTPQLLVPFWLRLIEMQIVPEPAEICVHWPDLNEPSAKDKAETVLKKTQALAAYISGGLESHVPPQEFYTMFMGMTVDEATAIVDAAKSHIVELEEA